MTTETVQVSRITPTGGKPVRKSNWLVLVPDTAESYLFTQKSTGAPHQVSSEQTSWALAALAASTVAVTLGSAGPLAATFKSFAEIFRAATSSVISSGMSPLLSAGLTSRFETHASESGDPVRIEKSELSPGMDRHLGLVTMAQPGASVYLEPEEDS